MEYTIDYFIEKFSAIPPHLWNVGSFGIYEGVEFLKKCALGHCGMSIKDCAYVSTPEADALLKIFGGYSVNEDQIEIKNYWHVYTVNDGTSGNEKYGSTPKERMLNKLYEIKQKQHATVS